MLYIPVADLQTASNALRVVGDRVLQLDTERTYRLSLATLADTVNAAIEKAEKTPSKKKGGNRVELHDFVNTLSPLLRDGYTVTTIEQVEGEEAEKETTSHHHWVSRARGEGELATVSAPHKRPAGRRFIVDDARPGVVVALGGTGAGKTHHFTKVQPCDIVLRWGEPSEEADEMEQTIHASSFTEALGLALVLSGCGLSVFWDSWRYAMYNLRGSAIKGGAIAQFFTALTSVSNLFAHVNGLVVIGVNPLADAEEDIRYFFRPIAGSVTGCVYFSRGQLLQQTFRLVSGRIFEKADSPVIEPLGEGQFSALPTRIDIQQLDDTRPLGTHLGDDADDDTLVEERGFTRFSPKFDIGA